MDDALLMSSFKCFRDLFRNVERIFDGNGARLQVTPERFPLDVLHDKEPSAI